MQPNCNDSQLTSAKRSYGAALPDNSEAGGRRRAGRSVPRYALGSSDQLEVARQDGRGRGGRSRRSVGPLQIHLERNLLYVVLYGSTRAAQRRSRSKPAAQDVNIPMTDVRPRCRRRMRLRGDYCTEMAKKECTFLLSNSCLVGKQQQEEISRNHVPSLFAVSVHAADGGNKK